MILMGYECYISIGGMLKSIFLCGGFQGDSREDEIMIANYKDFSFLWQVRLRRRQFFKAIAFLPLSTRIFAFDPISPTEQAKPVKIKGGSRMHLPDPVLEGNVSLEQAIYERRTMRFFTGKSLNLSQLSQLMWAAQGITESGGFKRAAPSAGALYPMNLYGIIGGNSVEKLGSGVYQYDPVFHAIILIKPEDVRKEIARASLGQIWMAAAPVIFGITAEYRRITGKYGERGIRYAMIEAGHIGQNIFLQAKASGLDAAIVGAFKDREVLQAMEIKEAHEPLILMPVGYSR